MTEKSSKPELRELTPEQHHICREKGTEAPFSGKYYQHSETGSYHCASCGAKLFDSTTKYDSGSGWPSFWQSANQDAISYHTDSSHGMVRTEVTCAACAAHLGHVFDDGPQPTGKRYCINSLALDFTAQEED